MVGDRVARGEERRMKEKEKGVENNWEVYEMMEMSFFFPIGLRKSFTVIIMLKNRIIRYFVV